ncbi:mechanosensitive ion channel family protein [Candidatus Saccharibacteria bacterium]|nr:mechanosensitive ion channel family protein [Candidatus Saccharibacteria bacterium]
MIDDVGQEIIVSFDRVSSKASSWLASHFLSIVIILIFGYIAKFLLTKLMRKVVKQTVRHDLFPTESDKKKRLKTLDGLIGAIVGVVVWVVVIIMIINELGINTGPLLASAGVIGIVIGFGAQTLIKDFTTGLFIIAENQYRVGDVIEINGVSGVVEDITIRTTVLRDLDGHSHHIPNGSIDATTNMTMGYSNLHENFTVDLDTDIEQLEHIINHVGEQLTTNPSLKGLIIEPPKFTRVTGFNNDGLMIKVVGKTTPGDQWQVQGEFYKQLKKAFDRHKIGIPYPQVTVHQAKKS